jgi:hypothetical protein
MTSLLGLSPENTSAVEGAAARLAAADEAAAYETARIKAARSEKKDEADAIVRSIAFTTAATIKPKAVRWLWEKRLPLGELSIMVGREGIAKSTLMYTLASQVTKGTMEGVHFGTPKSVIVAATEDSWETTIVPRLMAAEADLTMVLRVDVVTTDDDEANLCLPSDLMRLREAIELRGDVALLLLDPLMSRISGKLNTHVDGEVRRALEPLALMGKEAGVTIVGILHVNKGAGTDSLNLVMGSKAFSAVPRAVHMAMKDPNSPEGGPQEFLFGLEKSNLGPTGLPTFRYRIEEVEVGTDEDDFPIVTGRIVWLGESESSISEALVAASGDPEKRTAARDAAEWIREYMTVHGHRVPSADIKRASHAAGHSDSALSRGRDLLKLDVQRIGFPGVTYWEMPWGGEGERPADVPTPGPIAEPGEAVPFTLVR